MKGVPFLSADYMSGGATNRRGEWVRWWEGVWRLVTPEGLGVVRWHCPHRHKGPESAQRCALKEVRRRFGNAGKQRGRFIGGEPRGAMFEYEEVG